MEPPDTVISYITYTLRDSFSWQKFAIFRVKTLVGVKGIFYECSQDIRDFVLRFVKLFSAGNSVYGSLFSFTSF